MVGVREAAVASLTQAALWCAAAIVGAVDAVLALSFIEWWAMRERK